jgi:hypothetical protein
MSQHKAHVRTDLFDRRGGGGGPKNVPGKDRGTNILILDGHASHCSSPELTKFAKENV